MKTRNSSAESVALLEPPGQEMGDKFKAVAGTVHDSGDAEMMVQIGDNRYPPGAVAAYLIRLITKYGCIDQAVNLFSGFGENEKRAVFSELMERNPRIAQKYFEPVLHVEISERQVAVA